MYIPTPFPRYSFCVWILAGLLFAGLLHGTKRPNILWVTLEDTSPQFIGCYGNPHAKTPTIDSLASKGLRFNRAFATGAVCSSSRCAIITGVFTEQLGTGHHRSKYRIPDTIRGFPAYLREAGYHTSNNRKTDYNIANEKEFSELAWCENGEDAGWKNRKEGQPFFSVFNFMDSHQSRTMTNPWSWYEKHVLEALDDTDLVDEMSFEIPPFYFDSPDMRRAVSRVYHSLTLTDHRIHALLEELKSDGLEEDTILFVFSDHGQGIPYGKCNPVALGYRVPFIVCIPQAYQHLLPHEPGSSSNELLSFVDLAPTMLAIAGCQVPAHMSGRVFMGSEREEPPAFVFASRNRIDETSDLARSVSDGKFIYTRVFLPHLPTLKYQKYADVSDIVRQIRSDYRAGVLNESQSRFLGPRPPEFLFDIENDPWELFNLADQPGYATIKETLSAAVKDHAFDYGDIHFLPESIMQERTKGSSAYAIRRNHQLNPIHDLYLAASLVGVPNQYQKLMDLMKHPDEAVRYWAALGLRVANDAQLKEEELARLLSFEQSEPVLVELAALSYLRNQDPKASRILNNAAMSDNLVIATQALQSILYMGDSASDFIELARARIDHNRNLKGSLKYESDCSAEMILYLYANEPLEY